MTSTTNHVDAAASSASAGVDGSGGGGAGSGSGGDEVCSLSDNEFQKFLEDATTFNRPLSEASPLFRALLDRKNDDDDVVAVGGAELRHLNSDCSHQTHRQRQNPRQRIPGANPVSVSGGPSDGTCLDAVATSAVLRGAAARTTQGGSLQNLHVRPVATERMEVDNSDDDGKERVLAPVKQTEEVDSTVNFFLKPRVAVKAEDAKVLSRGEDKQTVQCLSNTGNSVTAAANKIKNQTRRVLSREVVSDEGYAPKHLDENGNPLGFDNHVNQHSKTYPGSACNRSHLLPRVVSASDVRGGSLLRGDSDGNLSCSGALGVAGIDGHERGLRSKTRRPKATAGKDNVTTAEKIPGHFWDDNIEVMVDFINSVGSGGFGKETQRQKGRKAPVNVRKEHHMVNGQQQHEAEEDADAEEEENAEWKPRKKDKAKSKRQRMDANDRWSHVSDNSSASDDVGVVANDDEDAATASDKAQEQEVVVKREEEVAPVPPQRLVPSKQDSTCDPESGQFKVGACSATTASATVQEAESAAFRDDFYAVAVSEIPPCLEDDFHVVTGKKHRRGRSAGNPSGGGTNPGSSSSSSRGRARNSDPGERRTTGDRDMMLWSGLHHYHRGHQRTSFGIGAGTDVDLRRKSTGSVPPSEHSSGDNSDIDSVHSLPVSSTTPKPSVDKTSASSSCTPHTSYADIARMASSSSASSSSCFPPVPPHVPGVAATDTERKEAGATTASVVSAAPPPTVDTVTRGGDIRDDDEAIMEVCGGGDTRFVRDNFTVDDEASRTSTEPSSPATPVVVDTSLAALAMGPVAGPWDDRSLATPVVIIFADGLECECDSGRARAQVSFGFDVNEQLLRMTLSDGCLPGDVAGAPSSSSSSTADNVTVSVGFRFGDHPTIRDRDPLRETRWSSYVPGKEGHRFNYINVVNYIGQSWEIVRREMDGGSEGSIRYYSGDCM